MNTAPQGVQFKNHLTRSTNQSKVASLTSGRKIAAGHHPGVKKPMMVSGNGVVGSASATPKRKGVRTAGKSVNPATVGSPYSPSPAAKGII